MKRMVNALSKLSWGRRAYAVFALCATTAISLPAQTFTTLLSFDGTDGANPYAGLVQATNGDLYGTTYSGGVCCGTVFKITPVGRLTTLSSFSGTGNSPWAGLVQATNGDFYGTTYGGTGTVFKITPSGTLTTLHSFAGYPTDGAAPIAGLVQATNGDFYGTTYIGGTSSFLCFANVSGCGTVFKITPGGTLTTLYSFCSQSECTDGGAPWAGLVQAANGDLYGTTAGGGTSGNGTVFKITPSGTLTTLYSFCPQGVCTDGASPVAGLVQAANGDFYGTTFSGGANCVDTSGCGTVFKITPSGTLTTLYSFCSQGGYECTDGADPAAGLVQATDGNFYGTTYHGGANDGFGTIFKITPSGTLTTLYSFCAQSGCPDGAYPNGLVQATNGDFYGTAPNGGRAYGYGTVFSLSVSLGPFVETQTTVGKVGATVKILGSDLTGATSVSFNGTAATFTVVSPSLITTTVPAGATTGKVQVVTPSGTLSSYVPFRVLP